MDRKSIACLALELTDRHDLTAREALMTANAEFLIPGAPIMGREGSSAYSRPILAAFPGARHRIDAVLEADDSVVIEGVWIGIHSQTLATPNGDVPATGRSVELPFTVVFRFDGELVRSVHVYFDQLSFLSQLGLVPVPQAA